MFKTISDQQSFGSRLLIGALWALTAIVALSAAAGGGPWLGLGLASAALAGAATVICRLDANGPATRMAMGVSLMAAVSLLVAAFTGRPWQIDMHMAYFAALAALIIYCDWKVIAAAAATVAVHHLLLSFVLPAAVFPGGGDLGRVILHAVVLVVEAVVLVWAAESIQKMFAASSSVLAEATGARQVAEEAMRTAESARLAETNAARESAKMQSETDRERAVVVEGLAEGLERLSQGDLAFRVKTAFPIQYEKLRTDFNSAVARLDQVVGGISAVAQVIHSGSGEISAAADDLSRRTEQQAASLEETAAAVDEIAATIKRTAEGAVQANEAVSKARAAAEDSGEVVRRAIAAMTEIEGSATQISQIIGVIDEIAFQTNLLALNAGVEAARAGEAGKGFAVVATEVRALAQRSAEAAKEIKTLISASTQQVGEGVELVGQTGTALERIVVQVSEIASLVSEIASSTREQSTGLGEVNTAVNHMDRTTQQNAAMVEQSTAASHSLAQEADQLATLVNSFRVGGKDVSKRAA